MSFKPTLEDMLALDAKLESEKSSSEGKGKGKFVPTLEHMQALDRQLASEQDQSNPESQVGFLSNAYNSAMQPLRNIGPWVEEGVKRAPENLSKIARGILQSSGKIASGAPMDALAASMQFGAPGLFPGSQELAESIRKSQTLAKKAKLLTPEEEQTGAAKVGEFIGESLPFMAIPGGAFTKSPDAIQKLIAGLYPALQPAAKLGARIGQGAAVGAPVSALTQPDDMSGAALTGGLIGGATSGLLPIIGGIPGKIAQKIPKLFGGTHSPEEIKAIVQASQEHGIKIPLGDVIGSPLLKEIQTGLTNVPGSGMQSAYSKASKGIGDAYANAIKKLGPDEQLPNRLKESLISKRKTAAEGSNRLYPPRDEYAEKIGFEIPSSSYKDRLAKIEEDIAQHKKVPSYEASGGYAPLERILSSTKNIPEKRSPTLTQIDRRGYYDAAEEYARKGEKYLAKQFRSLGDAINKDMNLAYTNAKDPKLLELHRAANKHYQENVLPLDDKLFIKSTRKTTDPDTIIPMFLRTGKVERPELLNKLVSQLNPEEKNALAAHYLTRNLNRGLSGEVEYSPTKISTAYEKLGDKTKKILFSPETNKELKSLATFRKVLGSNSDQLFIPKTGVQAAKMIGSTPAITAASGLFTMSPHLMMAGLGAMGGSFGVTKSLISKRLQRAMIKEYGNTPRISQSAQNRIAPLPLMLQNFGSNNQGDY